MDPVMTHIAISVKDIEATCEFYHSYCGLKIVHQRTDNGLRVAWLAEKVQDMRFVIVALETKTKAQFDDGISHLGFALDSREAVDRMAERGKAHLAWPPRELPYPVGYFCALKDPDGNYVEFSYGQPLGPGSEIRDTALFGRQEAMPGIS